MSRWRRWNRFRWRSRPSYLKPLRGKPFNNIPKWCYERNKKMKESPLSNKTRTVKEKDINTGYLSRVLTALVSRLNEAIRWISRIPPLEHKVEELEKEVRRLRLAVAANTAIDLKHRKVEN